MITFPFSFIKSAGGGGNPATTYINAVLAAGGSLNATEQTAITNFYNGLASDGIYSKLYFMHPFLGGTANSNKIDFINPGGTYDLGFNGTWTHSTGGSYSAQTVHPNYPNYADTNYDVSTNNLTTTIATDWSFGAMMSNVQRTAASFGYMGVGPSANYMVIGSDGNNQAENYFPGQLTNIFPGVTKANGFINTVMRSGANAWEVGTLGQGEPISGGLLYNGPTTGTYTQPGTVKTIYYNAISGVGYPTGGNYLFGWGGRYLTRTQMNQFVTRVNTLQAVFGRNIFI